MSATVNIFVPGTQLARIVVQHGVKRLAEKRAQNFALRLDEEENCPFCTRRPYVPLRRREPRAVGVRGAEWIGSPTDVGHYVLDPGVVLERVVREILAVPGVLEAAVRHLSDERDVTVHPDRSRIDGG